MVGDGDERPGDERTHGTRWRSMSGGALARAHSQFDVARVHLRVARLGLHAGSLESAAARRAAASLDAAEKHLDRAERALERGDAELATDSRA
jgi:hypothetical protein